MLIKGLADDNALLKKMFEHERDRANEWQQVAEREKKSAEALQAKLSECIKKRTDLKKKYQNTVKNRAMFNWFLEYLADGYSKEIAYFHIYVDAVKAGFIKKVVHKDHENANAADWRKGIEGKIRKRLKAHCKRNKIPYPD